MDDVTFGHNGPYGDAWKAEPSVSILLTASLGGSERVWGRPSAEGASQVEAPQAPREVGCMEGVSPPY